MCLELWRKDCNPVFQGLHFAYSLGGLLSPLIAAPFLENIRELSNNIDNNMDNTTFLNDMVDMTANIFQLFGKQLPFFRRQSKLNLPIFDHRCCYTIGYHCSLRSVSNFNNKR